MKVLVIHGSPHNGNTLKLTRKFEEAVKKLGDVSFEYLTVRDLNIRMCRGCFNCITKGEELCPVKDDDVWSVIKKMDEADGTVISIPTYMYNVPAVMKNLIDRLSYLGHRPRYPKKYAAVISTTCGVGLKEAIRYISLGTAGAWGFKLAGTLGAYTHPFYLDKKHRKRLDDNTEKLAGKFYRALSGKELPRVRFPEMMRFLSMKTISTYSREFFPADYGYYHENKDIGKKYYFNNAKIGLITGITSKFFAFLMSRSMKKLMKKSDMHQKFLE